MLVWRLIRLFTGYYGGSLCMKKKKVVCMCLIMVPLLGNTNAQQDTSRLSNWLNTKSLTEGWTETSAGTGQLEPSFRALPGREAALKSDKSLAWDPEIEELLREGYNYSRLGMYEEALTAFLHILERDQDNRQARNALSTTYIMLERYDSAIQMLESLLVEFPADYILKNNLAWIYATATDSSIKNGRKAVELAQDALLLSPENYQVWGTLAEAYSAAGNMQKAHRAVREALVISEEKKAAKDEIENYRSLVKQYKRAASSHDD